MKKKFFLAGLVLSLSLVGCCGDDGIPTKGKYSNEVSYAEFDSKLEGIVGNDALSFGSDSFVAKSRVAYNTTQLLVDENDAKVGNATSKVNYEYNGKHDSVNDISRVTTKGSSKTVMTLNGETTKTNDSCSFTRTYQVYMDTPNEEDKETVSINERDKEYYIVGDYDDHEPAAYLIEPLALPILFYAFGTANFENKSQAEKDKWKFYIDSGLFTAVYTETKIQEKTHSVDGESVKYADYESTEVDLIQFRGKNTEGQVEYLSIYFEMVTNKKTSYVSTYEDDGFVFTAGQTLTEKSKVTCAMKITVKNVSLTAIDLTDYESKETDTEKEKYDIF